MVRNSDYTYKNWHFNHLEGTVCFKGTHSGDCQYYLDVAIMTNPFNVYLQLTEIADLYMIKHTDLKGLLHVLYMTEVTE